MPSTYNFATQASPKVAEAFYKSSITEGIFSQDYDWTGEAAVRIYSVDDLPIRCRTTIGMPLPAPASAA